MRRSGTQKKTAKGTANWARVTLAASAIIAVATALLYLSIGYRATGVHTANASASESTTHQGIFSQSLSANALSPEALSGKRLPAKSMSLPLFFEPNQGQTAPQVKFLARGSGYGLFLTSDAAVLELQSPTHGKHSLLDRPAPSSVIRMRLDGANSSAQVSGTSPLPGKSNYFIGNNSSKWRQNIPQFGGVQYQAVYKGVDLVYYGNQGQLEYDFRVAPGSDPNQIALTFDGTSARIAPNGTADSGDLILSTANGDIRFHAPHIYQPATSTSGNSSADAEKTIAGSFRQFADNKIGFTIGDYDPTRELVIDPILSYSTYLGGTGVESLVQVAVDTNLHIYVAGSTTSTDFPTTPTTGANPTLSNQLTGTQNIFIAVLDPTLAPTSQLVWATYLGGTGSDYLTGLAVDQTQGIYVAGATTSSNFPTTANAFQTVADVPGLHGFLSKIALNLPPNTQAYALAYSTYLAGNGTDIVAGVAVDSSQNAYLTGSTTSNQTTLADDFPATPNGYQLASNSPNNPQFFATKINTNYTHNASVVYSTYFGGSNPATAIAGCSASNLQPPCGGIAVDTAGNMYITSWTNMLPVGLNGGKPFPLFDAQQPCLNQGSTVTQCANNNPTATDAFVAKIDPNFDGASSLIYSTYLGGNGNDMGLAIAVDSSSNAYVVGSTYSDIWATSGAAFQLNGYALNGDGFLAEIGNLSGSTYPLNYLTYLGGSGTDVANAVQVDSTGAAHIAGTTNSQNFPVTADTYQPTNAGEQDAFVASILPSGVTGGDFSTYLGGSLNDQGTGVAIDIYGATYVAGNTVSPNFPTANPFQLTTGTQDAFVTKLGSSSRLTIVVPTSSPAPTPADLGTQVAFTFNITNNGPDTAYQVNFLATVLPNAGLSSLSSPPTGRITGGASGGTCQPAQSGSELVSCFIPSLASGGVASVEIDATTNATTTPSVTAITVSGSASANGSGVSVTSQSQTVNVVDFSVSAGSPTPSATITAGQSVAIPVSFCPTSSYGYSGTITPTDTISPSMVTASTPTFTPTSVSISGSCEGTSLTIATVARPGTTGSLPRHNSFYATWLPIGGLSFLGLGIGAGRKRRRWFIGAVLALIAGAILILPSCGSASTTTPTGGGTQPGTYYVTISGSAGTASSHTAVVKLQVN